jgi:TetR/AcrR family transcriptional repressor of nem operon
VGCAKTTRRKLIDSARYLLQKHGYNGLSYPDVAEQGQLRKASIHHHLPAKVDLGPALLDESQARIE